MQSKSFCFYPVRKIHLPMNWSTSLRDWREIFHLRSKTLIETQKSDRLTSRFNTLRPMMH